jgi:Na+/proline symporter
MSSADSALLAAASVYSTNLLPYFKPDASDRQKLFHTRIIIPIFGVFALVLALEVQAVFDLIVDANSMLLACVVAPFIVGIWWRKPNRWAAQTAMALGFIVWIGTVFLAPDLPGDLLGFLTALITLLVVTPLTQRQNPPRPLVDGDGKPVELTDRLGILPLFRRVESEPG